MLLQLLLLEPPVAPVAPLLLLVLFLSLATNLHEKIAWRHKHSSPIVDGSRKASCGDELGVNVLFCCFFFGVLLLALLFQAAVDVSQRRLRMLSLFSFLFISLSFSFFALTKTLDTPPESLPERGEVKSL